MKEETRTVVVLSVIVFLVLLGITILTPVLPFYAQFFGATDFMVGLLISGYALARVAVDLPAGVLGDRRGQRRVMAYGLALIATSSVVAGFAFNYWVLLAVRVVEGAGSALYVTSSVALLARVAPPRKRGQYMSYYVAALLLGGISGPATGGYVALYLGLRAPFFFYASVAAVGLVLVALYLPATPSRPTTAPISFQDVGSLLRNPSFLIVTLGVLAAFFVRGGISGVIFPLWSEAKFGFDTGTIGLLLTVAAVASLGTMLPSGHLADRYGRKLPFMGSLLLTATILPFLFSADTFASLTVMMVGYGLALGLHGPMAAWAVDLVPEARIGTAMGVYRMIGDLGWVLGPLVLTGVREATGPVATNVFPWLLASVWLAAFGLLLALARDPVARKGPPPPAVPGGG